MIPAPSESAAQERLPPCRVPPTQTLPCQQPTKPWARKGPAGPAPPTGYHSSPPAQGLSTPQRPFRGSLQGYSQLDCQCPTCALDAPLPGCQKLRTESSWRCGLEDGEVTKSTVQTEKCWGVPVHPTVTTAHFNFCSRLVQASLGMERTQCQVGCITISPLIGKGLGKEAARYFMQFTSLSHCHPRL